jgi:UPF0271 protein
MIGIGIRLLPTNYISNRPTDQQTNRPTDQQTNRPIMDLNADLGESWYNKKVGNDADLMPFLSSCNLACGFHGGDASTMHRTLLLALEHGVAIGAHPSFPDRKHFGRKMMSLPLEDLINLIRYQVFALQGMARSQGTTLHHVKPHGALYHYVSYRHSEAAEAIVQVCREAEIDILYGPPNSFLESAAQGAGLTFWAEGFADRAYEPDLKLANRTLPNATLDDPELAAEQARMITKDQRVRCTDGVTRSLKVQTLCLHGDHPGAVERARAIKSAIG